MKTKRVVIGHIAFYTSSRKEYYGVFLCDIGIHKIRLRKNGKKTEAVCVRRNCQYCKKVVIK